MASKERVAELASVLDSGNTARELLGNALVLLSKAYTTTATYEGWGLGAGVADVNREYLDGIRIRAEADFQALPATSSPLPERLRNQVAFDIASIEAASNQTLDLLGRQSAIGEFVGSVADAGRDIVGGAVGAVGKAVNAVVPWWLWIIVAGVAVSAIWLKKGKNHGA